MALIPIQRNVPTAEDYARGSKLFGSGIMGAINSFTAPYDEALDEKKKKELKEEERAYQVKLALAEAGGKPKEQEDIEKAREKAKREFTFTGNVDENGDVKFENGPQTEADKEIQDRIAYADSLPALHAALNNIPKVQEYTEDDDLTKGKEAAYDPQFKDRVDYLQKRIKEKEDALKSEAEVEVEREYNAKPKEAAVEGTEATRVYDPGSEEVDKAIKDRTADKTVAALKQQAPETPKAYTGETGLYAALNKPDMDMLAQLGSRVNENKLTKEERDQKVRDLKDKQDVIEKANALGVGELPIGGKVGLRPDEVAIAKTYLPKVNRDESIDVVNDAYQKLAAIRRAFDVRAAQDQRDITNLQAQNIFNANDIQKQATLEDLVTGKGDEGKNRDFAKSANTAVGNMNKVLKEGYDPSKTVIVRRNILEAIPWGVGKTWGQFQQDLMNQARTPEERRYIQAATEYAMAILRKDSGAVISKDELDQQFFMAIPGFGDDPATMEQKLRGIESRVDSLESSSGVQAIKRDKKGRIVATGPWKITGRNKFEYDSMPVFKNRQSGAEAVTKPGDL